MIYAIVAVDSKLGLANDKGIPWDLPTDKAFFRQKTTDSIVLMGYGTYVEFDKPLSKRRNLVATAHHGKNIKTGFELVKDATQTVKQFRASGQDLWVIGGAGLFEKLLKDIDTLYLTRVTGDFKCTKFFPKFEDQFELVEDGRPQSENNLTFKFQVWQRRRV